jgi:transposase
MKNILYVGIDYHQKSLQVCAMQPDGKIILNQACSNDVRKLRQLLAKQKPSEIRAAIEACCGAADLAEEISACPQWSISLAHPGYVNRMKQTPDKTDFSDARMLADLTRVGYLPRVWLAPKVIRELRTVVHYRATLVEQRRNTKLRIGGLLREQRIKAPEGVNRWTRKWLEWLTKVAPLSPAGRKVADALLAQLNYTIERIAEAETLLAEMTAEDPVVRRLMEMKAIGLVTATILRAEIGHFDRFANGKQLSHFTGLSPRNASSGQRQADAGLINSCNRMLRATLIEAAHRLIRLDPQWQHLAGRLRKKGKPVAVTIAAVANRWVRWLWHQMVHPQTPQQAMA